MPRVAGNPYLPLRLVSPIIRNPVLNSSRRQRRLILILPTPTCLKPVSFPNFLPLLPQTTLRSVLPPFPLLSRRTATSTRTNIRTVLPKILGLVVADIKPTRNSPILPPPFQIPPAVLTHPQPP